MSNYFEALFNHNQEIITIQVNLKEIWKDIIKKYINKSGLDIKSIYFVYSGIIINENKTVEEIIISDDKITKKMRILVNDIERTIIDERIIN